MIHLDTSFLVDLIREQRRGVDGPARTWIAANRSEGVALSVLVVCELMLGAALHAKPIEERARVRQLIGRLPVVNVDERVPARYASVAGELNRRGSRLATMDLLIACVALVESAPLLTGNVSHFELIPGLQVLSY